MLTRDSSISPAIAELPVSLLVEKRTGPSISSAELTALAVTAPREETSSALSLRMALLGAMLGAGSTYSATAAEQSIQWVPGTTTAARSGPSTLALSALSGSFDIALRGPDRLSGFRSAPSKPEPVVRHTRTGITPAEELRALTGLSPHLLANLFGVSRTSYYKWMEGSIPRDAKYNHPLEVLSHVRDVSGRVAEIVDVAAWLRTPVSPGGKTPLDYLRDQRFTAFRGFALKAASGQMNLDVPQPVLREAQLGAKERAALRRRINPTPRTPEPESGKA